MWFWESSATASKLLLVSKESLEILWSFCTVDFGGVNLVYNCCFRNIYRYFVGDLLFLCVKSAMQFKREQQSCHVIFRCIPVFGFFGRPMRFRRVQQSWQGDGARPSLPNFAQISPVNIRFTASNIFQFLKLNIINYELKMALDIKLPPISWWMILVQNWEQMQLVISSVFSICFFNF